MAFYAATAPVKAADQIQHLPALVAQHDHADMGGFSVYVIHDGGLHADGQDDDPLDENQPDDPLGPGHHHGDTGPNLIVPNIVTAIAMTPSANLHVVGKDRQIAGLRSIGPERPPRLRSLNA